MFKSIGLFGGLKWAVKNKREILNDSQGFDLSNQKVEVACNWEEKTAERTGFGRDSQELRVEYVSTELPISHPNKEVN